MPLFKNQLTHEDNEGSRPQPRTRAGYSNLDDDNERQRYTDMAFNRRENSSTGRIFGRLNDQTSLRNESKDDFSNDDQFGENRLPNLYESQPVFENRYRGILAPPASRPNANGFDASNDGYFDDPAIRQQLIDNTFGDPAGLRYARYQAQARVNNASGRWQSYTNPMFAGNVPYEAPLESVYPILEAYFTLRGVGDASIALWVSGRLIADGIKAGFAALGRDAAFDITSNVGLFSSRAEAVGSVGFGAKKIIIGRATEENALFTEKGMNPPYDESIRPRTINLNNPRTFVRVHGEINQARSWMMRAREIEGLTPLEIQDKFALPELPRFVSEVDVPAGTSLRVSRAAPIEGWGSGGGTQYELLQRIPESSYKNTMPLLQPRIEVPESYIEDYQNWRSTMLR
jgi:hypothetical protein